MSVRHLSRWVLAGLLSTLTMDVGAALVRKTGFTTGVTPALLGRWFASLAHGQFRHQTIVDAPSSRSEMPLALGGHYFIGITLTLAFGALVFIIARARPALTTGIALALGFGFATNLLPWLIMFPAMGFGPFGCAGPPALMLFRSSFVNHSIFAIGLALSTRALGLLRA